MVIFMAMSNGYTNVLCFPPSEGLITVFIPLVLLTILVLRNLDCFHGKTPILIISLVLFLWIFLQYLKYRIFYDMNLYLILDVYIAFILARIYGYKTIVLFERNVVFLSVVGLLFWGIYNIYPAIADYLKVSYHHPRTLVTNIFIYSFANSEDILGFRNAGFASEPGIYAVFLIMAMFFNLKLNEYNFKNISFFILFISLITTQSTTGYLSFVCIIIVILFKSHINKVIASASIAIMIPIVLSLPFMLEKIENYISTDESIAHIEETAGILETSYGNSAYVPQRFDGFVLESWNFLHDPLLGYGIKYNETSYVAQTISPLIYCSNGNIKVFAVFGLFIGAIFFYYLYKSGVFLFNEKKIAWTFLFMFVVITMSYDLTTIPLLLSIWWISLFSKYKAEI